MNQTGKMTAKKRGWRSTLRVTVRGITKRAKRTKDYAFLKIVLAELAALHAEIKLVITAPSLAPGPKMRAQRKAFQAQFTQAQQTHPNATDRELATALGVSVRTIYRYRTGKHD